MLLPTAATVTRAARALLGAAVSAGALAISGGAVADEYDPVAAGLQLAAMYCADCHAIATSGDSPFPPAPPFRELHLRYDVEFLAEALVEGIVTAHPEMPEFEFDPDQAEAIIAYLKTLEP